jgi:hypothetical protein
MKKLIFLCLIACKFANAQVINEGFEEAEWVAGTTTGTASINPAGTVVTVNATGTASVNNGTWSYSAGIPAGTGSSSSNSTIVKTGTKSFWFGQNGGGYILTPVITGGITTVTFSAIPYGSSSVGLFVAVATNTALTSNASSIVSSATNGTAGPWIGSAYNLTLNTASGFSAQNAWATISFTTNIPAGQSAYLKLQRQGGGQFFIDDLVVTGAAPLPVNFSSVSATQKENSVTVDWSVASQINVKAYSLEKSTDGNLYTEVAQIFAVNGSSNYSANDAKPAATNYYRIKAIDNDGSSKYSKTISVSTKLKGILQAYPNPTITSLTVSYPKALDNSVVQIISADGRRMAIYKVGTGTTNTVIDVSKLTTGNYVLQYNNDGKTMTTNFVKR